MRCTHCNIDLASDVKTCPLCGSEAADEAPVLTELHDAPYPSYENVAPEKVKAKTPNPHVLRVALILSAVFVLLGESTLWTVVTPFLLVNTAIVYLIFGLREKGSLLHAAVSLIISFAFQALFFLHALLHRMSLAQILFSITVTLVALVVLYFKYPERFEAQMEATFHL